MRADDDRFRSLVDLYWAERNDRVLNVAWHDWRSVDGLCPPLLTPRYSAAKMAMIEDMGLERYEEACDRYSC